MEKILSACLPISSKQPHREITLDRVYRLITTDSDLRGRTEKFRFYLRVGNKRNVGLRKDLCPAFLPAVRCEGGRKRDAYRGLYRFEPLRFGSYTGRTDGGGFCGGLCRPPCPFGLPYDQRTGLRVFTLFSLKTAVPSRTPTLPIGRRSGSTRRATDRVTNFRPASPGWNTTAVCKESRTDQRYGL